MYKSRIAILLFKFSWIAICWLVMNLLIMNFGFYRGNESEEVIMDSKIEYQKSTKGWLTSASISILSEFKYS